MTHTFPTTIRLLCIGGPAHGFGAQVIAWNPYARVKVHGGIYIRRIIAPLGQPVRDYLAFSHCE